MQCGRSSRFANMAGLSSREWDRPPRPRAWAVRLPCFYCSKSVSSELPEEAVVRAICVCPECIEAGKDEARLREAEAAIRAIWEDPSGDSAFHRECDLALAYARNYLEPKG